MKRLAANIQCLLRCGSCRFAAYYFLSFQMAILDSGEFNWGWVAFGAPFWFLHSMAVELLNRYSDRTEDRINRPERTALCESVGYRTIKMTAIALCGLLALVYCAWLYLRPNLILGCLLWSALAAAVCYSFVFRFKAHRYFSLVILTFPFGGPFLVGWAATHGTISWGQLWHEGLYHLSPFLLIGGCFFLSHAGIKDITDIAGDEYIGYRSMWVGLLRRRAHLATLLLVSSAFLLDLLFVSLGALPPRYLFLLLLWPLSVLFAVSSSAAVDVGDRAAVRELFYSYWMAFLSVACLLFVPSLAALLSVLGVAAYWVIASQSMHWTAGVTGDTVRRVVGLLRVPGPPAAAHEKSWTPIN